MENALSKLVNVSVMEIHVIQNNVNAKAVITLCRMIIIKPRIRRKMVRAR